MRQMQFDKCNVENAMRQMQYDKCNGTNSMWQMQSDKYNVTNALWQMQCDKHNSIYAMNEHNVTNTIRQLSWLHLFWFDPLVYYQPANEI